MRTIIPNTNVLDVVACRVLAAHDVIIEGNVIAEVRPTQPFASDSKILRGGVDRWIMPGLVDAHVHLLEVHEGPEAGRLPDEDLESSMNRGIANLEVGIAAGITTFRDVGAFQARNNLLRDRINCLPVPFARILSCGEHLSVQGGHFCDRGLIWDGSIPIEELVERVIVNGADFIKVMNDARIFGDNELKAIVSTAHHLGAHVACHAFTETQILQSILCGVDTIEHGYPATREIAELLAERGMSICPTIVAAVDSVASLADSKLLDAFPDCTAQEFRDWHANVSRHMATAFEKNLSVIAGTDAGILPTPFDSLHRELQFFGAHGASFWTILRSATMTASAALGISTDTGQLSAGKSADLVAVRQNPEGNLTAALRDIDYVLFRGNVVWESGCTT